MMGVLIRPRGIAGLGCPCGDEKLPARFECAPNYFVDRGMSGLGDMGSSTPLLAIAAGGLLLWWFTKKKR